MKLLKLRVTSDIFANVGHPGMFERIRLIQVLNILQYDDKNIFLLVKIHFKPEFRENWREFLESFPVITFIQPLKEIHNEVVCLLRFSKTSSFWPTLSSGPWAILPPMIVDNDSFQLTLIISEDSLENIYRFLDEFATSHELLAINDLNAIASNEPMLTPDFTDRQIEIARYAFKHGYFETPKRISSKELAEVFKVSEAAVTKNLRRASYLAMKYFFS